MEEDTLTSLISSYVYNIFPYSNTLWLGYSEKVSGLVYKDQLYQSLGQLLKYKSTATGIRTLWSRPLVSKYLASCSCESYVHQPWEGHWCGLCKVPPIWAEREHEDMKPSMFLWRMDMAASSLENGICSLACHWKWGRQIHYKNKVDRNAK